MKNVMLSFVFTLIKIKLKATGNKEPFNPHFLGIHKRMLQNLKSLKILFW